MQKLLLFFLIQLFVCSAFAQNVGIGTTNPSEKLHIQGNLRVENRSVYLGPDQRIYGDGNSALYFDGNHSTITQFIMRDAENEQYGRLYGSGDGEYFGFLDGDAQWSFIQRKDVYTGFRIDNSEKMRILANGHVGIGTGSPAGKLTIVSDSTDRGLDVISAAYGNTHIPYSDGRSYLSGQELVFRSNGNTERMRIKSNGYVGIGTSTPDHKLDVRPGGGKLKSYTYGMEFTVNTTGGWARGFRLRNEADSMSATVFGSLNGDAYIATGFNVNQAPTGYQGRKMVILKNGNVGIGSANPTTKLAVNGDIRSREVLVETANWPDYVFHKDYVLPTLQDEAMFIEENGHLSGFQSEKEMENVITVGDVTKRQQEKIEQMMLHLIEMQNDMNAYKDKTDKEISKLKAENQSLKSTINKEK